MKKYAIRSSKSTTLTNRDENSPQSGPAWLKQDKMSLTFDEKLRGVFTADEVREILNSKKMFLADAEVVEV